MKRSSPNEPVNEFADGNKKSRGVNSPEWNLETVSTNISATSLLKQKPKKVTEINTGIRSTGQHHVQQQLKEIPLREDNPKLVTLKVAAPKVSSVNDELIIIHNADLNTRTIPTNSPPLPTNELSDEYVIFAPDVLDYVNSDDYAISSSAATVTSTNTRSTLTKCVASVVSATHKEAPTCMSINSKSTIVSSYARKDINTTTIPATINSADGVAGITAESGKASAVGEIELLLLPTSVATSSAMQDPKIISLVSSRSSEISSCGGAGTTKTVVSGMSSGTNVMRPNTVSYSHVSTNVTTPTTSAHTAAGILNRVNLQTALKNQPLMVTAKKLMSEVTQTTAKVSIGNTTISVPLLKPLNSTQLLQQQNNSILIGDSQKHQQLHQQNQSATLPQATQMPAQTHLNLSKIINVKRGQKLNQPTIVSLSQLQIKPVSNAKIVQAKVVAKKMQMPLQLTQVPTNISTSSSALQSSGAGLVTITASKSSSTLLSSVGNKQGLIHNFSYAPKISQQLPNIVLQDMPLPQALLEDDDSSCISKNNETSAHLNVSSGGISHLSTDKGIKLLLGKTQMHDSKSADQKEPILSHTKIASTVESSTAAAANVKMLLTSTNMQPLLTQLSSQCAITSNKQQTITTMSTSTTPHHISTSQAVTGIGNNHHTISAISVAVSEAKKVSCTSGSPLISIPRNVSLMLTKSGPSQQPALQKNSPTLVSANKSTVAAAHNTMISCNIKLPPVSSSNELQHTKKINLAIGSTVNITSLGSESSAQLNYVGTATHSMNTTSSELTPKKTPVTSIGPALVSAGSLEQVALLGNTSKVGPELGVTNQQPLKRSKSTDEGDVESHYLHMPLSSTKRHSLEIISAKRSGIAIVDQPYAAEAASVKPATVAAINPHETLKTFTSDKLKLSEHSLSSYSEQNTIATQLNIPLSKPEETHNVLLKQLLQNSSSSHNPSQISTSTTTTSSCSPVSSASPMCNQMISARKVINVRAPSLGLVSSLEAQLARPVIPPVPANASSASPLNVQTTDVQSKLKKNTNITAEGNIKSLIISDVGHSQNVTKLKTSTQIISKETSFVSNPNRVTTTGSDSVPIETLSNATTNISKPTGSTTSNNLPYLISNSNQIDQPSPTTVFNTYDNLLTDQQSTQSIIINKIAQDGNRCSSSKANTQINQELQQPLSGSVTTSSSATLPLETCNTSLGVKLNLPLNAQAKSSLQYLTYNTKNQASSIDERNSNQTKNILNFANKPAKNTDNSKDLSPEVKTFSKNNDTQSNGQPPQQSQDVAATTVTSSTTTFIHSANSQLDKTCLPKSQISFSKDNNEKAKEIEMRKKRKREYQKHRRQLLNNSKDVILNQTANSSVNSSAKKRPRKVPKIEEDYDSFIDNMLTHIRQMQPLQVLEPLLNRNFGICSIYGRRNLTRIVSSKENEDQWLDQILKGEYGNACSPNGVALYDVNGLDDITIEKEQNLPTIQNDFYDQEFSQNLYNQQDKLLRSISFIRESNVDPMEIIKNKRSGGGGGGVRNALSYSCGILPRITYPGLILMNDAETQCIGRMSPVLPIVKPTSLAAAAHKSSPKIMKEIKMEYRRYSDMSEFKMGSNEDTDVNNQTVILSLPSSVADNIIGVLRDLANLLHIPPVTAYKIIEEPTCFSTKLCDPHNQAISNHSYRKVSQFADLQQILNGRRKMCRKCGKPIDALGIRANRNGFLDSKAMTASSQISTRHIHFCSKVCYTNFITRGKNYSNAVVTKELEKTESVSPQHNEKDVKFNINSMQHIEQRLTDKESKPTLLSKKCRFKYYNDNCFYPTPQFRRVSEKDVTDILFKMDITVSVNNNEVPEVAGDSLKTTLIEDTRTCVFCSQRGDGLSDGPSRLLNFEVDKWVHLNCALWSNGVYETISGGLMNFPTALQFGVNQSCSSCQQFGATVKCFKNRCGAVFHLSCAIKEKCVFYKNKTIHCHQHAPRTEKENELSTLSVHRRVFVERDENRQVATVMHHSELSNLLRVGSLTFQNVGQLLPHQLESFHTVNYIYPIGYKIVRLYWSMRRPNKRCRYVCSIAEKAGRPEFRIQVQEHMESNIDLRDSTPKGVWQQVMTPIAALRKEHELVQLFPQFISGEDLFGLTEPTIVRIIESLPGIETLTDYRFKYGRNPLLELPLAINPSGAARTEPKQRQLLGWKKPHTQRTGTTSNQRIANPMSSMVAGEVACPYSKQFVHSKSSQYKKMKQEWRNNVYLARSKIQGLGLYAARDMEKHTMIIEYIGEVIRTEVSEIREKQYEARNRGIYMFRLDEDRVVDATLSGGLARYINHCCNPNCVTEIVEVDREFRIIIFAKRRVNRGEELSYDYKFDIEDDANKISCMCGASNCRKWMN